MFLSIWCVSLVRLFVLAMLFDNDESEISCMYVFACAVSTNFHMAIWDMQTPLAPRPLGWGWAMIIALCMMK